MSDFDLREAIRGIHLRLDGLDRGARMEARDGLGFRVVLGEFNRRLVELEGRCVAERVDPVVDASPTCGTCRWYKADTLPVERCGTGRLMTGLCIAHPIQVAKHESDACGEHAPG
jgi:hypothetical protein